MVRPNIVKGVIRFKLQTERGRSLEMACCPNTVPWMSPPSAVEVCGDGDKCTIYSNVSKRMAKIPDTETINATQNGLYPRRESCVIWYLKEGHRVLCDQGRSMKGKSWNWSCLKSLNRHVQIF